MKLKNSRYVAIDYARGIFLLCMTLGHSFHFFLNPNSLLFDTVQGAINTITFTGLLFLSGLSGYIAYGNIEKNKNIIRYRVFKRTVLYLCGYYILSFLVVYALTIQDVSLLSIMLLQTTVPFTEFILPFIYLAVIFAVIPRLYGFFSYNIIRTTIIGVFISLFAYVVRIHDVMPLDLVQIHLIGGHEYYSFPLLPYILAYFVGIYVGNIYVRQSVQIVKRELIRLILLLSGVYLFLLSGYSMGIFIGDQFSRWPPTLSFVVVGLISTLIFFLSGMFSYNIVKKFILTNFIIYIGANAYRVFFIHSVLLFLIVASGHVQSASYSVVCILWVVTLILSVYIVRISNTIGSIRKK